MAAAVAEFFATKGDRGEIAEKHGVAYSTFCHRISGRSGDYGGAREGAGERKNCCRYKMIKWLGS